jgi:hypothetical protein
VACYTSQFFRERIESAGLRFLPLPADVDFDMRDLDTIFPERKTYEPGPSQMLFDTKAIFVDAIPSQYKGLKTILNEFPVDLVLYEQAFLGMLPLLLKESLSPSGGGRFGNRLSITQTRGRGNSRLRNVAGQGFDTTRGVPCHRTSCRFSPALPLHLLVEQVEGLRRQRRTCSGQTTQTRHSCHEPQSSDADRALLACKWTVSLCRRRKDFSGDICSAFWPDPGDKEYCQMREWTAGKITNWPAGHPFTEVRRRGLLRYAV